MRAAERGGERQPPPDESQPSEWLRGFDRKQARLSRRAPAGESGEDSPPGFPGREAAPGPGPGPQPAPGTLPAADTRAAEGGAKPIQPAAPDAPAGRGVAAEASRAISEAGFPTGFAQGGSGAGGRCY